MLPWLSVGYVGGPSVSGFNIATARSENDASDSQLTTRIIAVIAVVGGVYSLFRTSFRTPMRRRRRSRGRGVYVPLVALLGGVGFVVTGYFWYDVSTTIGPAIAHWKLGFWLVGLSFGAATLTGLSERQ